MFHKKFTDKFYPINPRVSYDISGNSSYQSNFLLNIMRYVDIDDKGNITKYKLGWETTRSDITKKDMQYYVKVFLERWNRLFINKAEFDKSMKTFKECFYSNSVDQEYTYEKYLFPLIASSLVNNSNSNEMLNDFSIHINQKDSETFYFFYKNKRFIFLPFYYYNESYSGVDRNTPYPDGFAKYAHSIQAEGFSYPFNRSDENALSKENITFFNQICREKTADDVCDYLIVYDSLEVVKFLNNKKLISINKKTFDELFNFDNLNLDPDTDEINYKVFFNFLDYEMSVRENTSALETTRINNKSMVYTESNEEDE